MLSKKEWTLAVIIPAALAVFSIALQNGFWIPTKKNELYVTSISVSQKKDWAHVIGDWMLQPRITSFSDLYPHQEKGRWFKNKRKTSEYMGSEELNNEQHWVSDYVNSDGLIGNLIHFSSKELQINDLGANLYHLYWSPSEKLVEAVNNADESYFEIFIKKHEAFKDLRDIWFFIPENYPELIGIIDKPKIDGHIWHPLFGKVSGNPKINIVISNIGKDDATILGVKIQALKVLNAAYGCGAGGEALEPINSDKLLRFDWHEKEKIETWNVPIVLEPGDKTMIQVELGIGEISGSICGPGEMVFSLALQHNFGSGLELKTIGQFRMTIEDNDLPIYWY